MNIDFINKFPSKSSDNLQWIYTDDLNAFNKHTQFVLNEPEKPPKLKKMSPFEFVTEKCFIQQECVKEKLMEFISLKEFQSVFGVKNTTEIVKGIDNNKWNKNLIILFSFLFDTSFIYLKKIVCFDKNQNYSKHYTI